MAKLVTQDGCTNVLMSHITSVIVHYYSQLKEGDPDVSYDVMVTYNTGEICVGRYPTLARAKEVQEEATNAVDLNAADYTVPPT